MPLAHVIGKCHLQVTYSLPTVRIAAREGCPWFGPVRELVTGGKWPATGVGKEATSVPEVRSPTVRRRELGARLRALRAERGFTVEQVAERLLCSPSKVSRMETGQRGATLRDIRDLCDLYGVNDEDEREQLMYLARQGKRPGWWQGYELDYFATYVGLEESAVSIKFFASSIVMGLVQTEAYARAMHEAGPEDFRSERIDELVEVRMKRQQLLTRDPPLEVHIVLDEEMLHRPVGGGAVMRDQLRKLVEVSASPHTEIQVVPYKVGAHPGMGSNFTVLEFAGSAPDVVYVEGLSGWTYLERPHDLDRYRKVFDRLCEMALNPRDSMRLIEGIAAAYNGAKDPVSGPEVR